MIEKRIVVVYHSQEIGNTEAAARLLAGGIRESSGFAVELHNTNEGRVEPRVLQNCAAAAIGTPDYFGYPAGGVKMFVDDWLIAKRQGTEGLGGMPVALFLTHGGGGDAQGPLEDLCHHIGPQVGETLSVKGHPEGIDAEKCEALGEELALRAAESMEE